MKKCSFCGANSDDDAKFCPSCGGSDFSEVGAEQGSTLNGAQTISQPVVPVQSEQPTAHAEQVAAPVRENIVAGAVGAFLFSLIGAALYVLIYQANIRYLRTCDFCSCKFRLRCFCSNKESFVRSEHSRVCHRDGCHDIHFGVYLHFFGNLQSIQRYRNNRF